MVDKETALNITEGDGMCQHLCLNEDDEYWDEMNEKLKSENLEMPLKKYKYLDKSRIQQTGCPHYSYHI